MSELIQKIDNNKGNRWKLLTGVSALALGAYTSSIGVVCAEDTGRPTVWIEVGGQLSALQDGQETFTPPLMDGRPSIFEPSQNFEKPPSHSFDEVGSISVQPNGSSWVFNASIRYGRSKTKNHSVQQTNPQPTSYTLFSGYPPRFAYPYAQRFAESTTSNSEQHTILDFEAGREVGFGLFRTPGSSSLFSFGVRFAQFGSTTNFSLKSDPDWHFQPKYASIGDTRVKFIRQGFHSNLAGMAAERSFHGIGPSVSWKASVPVAGNNQDGEILADWGINAAVLFGRQRAHTHHQSTARYLPPTKYAPDVPSTISRFPVTPDHTRSRNVVVPNIGGFAGLSFKYDAAKVSFGYRADFFFGAMDGGIDIRRTEDMGFHGPYASISIGLGG